MEKNNNIEVIAFLIVIIVILGALCALFATGFSRFFMDYLLTGKNEDLLYPFIIMLVIITLFQTVISWIQSFYSYRVSGKFAAVGNATFFWHVLKLSGHPFRFHKCFRIGNT